MYHGGWFESFTPYSTKRWKRGDLTLTDYGKYKEKHDSCFFKTILEPRESSKEKKKKNGRKRKKGKEKRRKKKKVEKEVIEEE